MVCNGPNGRLAVDSSDFVYPVTTSNITITCGHCVENQRINTLQDTLEEECVLAIDNDGKPWEWQGSSPWHGRGADSSGTYTAHLFRMCFQFNIYRAELSWFVVTAEPLLRACTLAQFLLFWLSAIDFISSNLGSCSL